MIIQEIGKRGVLFDYEDGTMVYLISTEKRNFLCDTHCGPDSMQVVKDYIAKRDWQDKEMIVFNSHAHWDHIWGNCAFSGNMIIAQEECLKGIVKTGAYDLACMPKDRQLGKVELTLPNLTFDHRLTFVDDQVEFIHTPGHTAGCSICVDWKESVLYIGDLVESPLPYLLYHDLAKYIQSLEFIQGLSTETIIMAHMGVIDRGLIDVNLQYIRDVNQGDVDLSKYGDPAKMHDFNMKNFMIAKYLHMIQEKLGERMEYATIMREVWGQFGLSENELGEAFKLIIESPYEVLEAGWKQFYARL